MAALLLSAVGGTGWETGLYCVSSRYVVLGMTEVKAYIALSADHLLAVELRSKRLQRWLDDTTTKT